MGSLNFLPPEYIGLFLSVFVFSVIIFGYSFEEYLFVNNQHFVNFNILSLFYFVAPILFELFMFDYYDPNYRYLKLLMPYSQFQIFCIDFCLEFFSFKFLFVLLFPILYLIFSYFNKFSNSYYGNSSGVLLILLMYVNSSLLIGIIKNNFVKRKKRFAKNFIKLMGYFFIAFLIVNSNLNIIDLDKFETIFLMIKISAIAIPLQICCYFILSSKIDKC